jgi:hypothetical protein
MQIGLGIKLGVIYDHEQNISQGFGEKQSIQLLMKNWHLSPDDIMRIIDEDRKEQEMLESKGEII